MNRAAAILVAGKAGQVARCLRDAALKSDIPLVAFGRPELDIGEPHSVTRLVRDIAPAAIINAAAYTAVDKAEAEQAEAYRINCTGAANLAKAAAERNIPFIHISTDYVFDGTGKAPYRESDRTSPLGSYGRSKRDGEIEVMAAYPNAVVVRTSWVYSAFGSNFLRTMMRLADTQPVVRVVNDQRGSPTSAHELAPALLKITARLSSGANNTGGIYHLTNGGETTWAGFAQAIFESLRSQGKRAPELLPIETSEYPTPAKRPAYSVLDCALIERTFGVRLPQWRESLETCLHTFVEEPVPC